MTRFIVIVAALLATAGLAHAECTCEGVDNCLGVYFDEGQWAVTCLEEPPAYQPLHMYFVLQNSVFDAVGGIEFAWRFDNPPTPAPLVLSATFPPGSGCFIDPVNVMYGVSIPIPATGPVVVMDLLLSPSPSWSPASNSAHRPPTRFRAAPPSTTSTTPATSCPSTSPALSGTMAGPPNPLPSSAIA